MQTAALQENNQVERYAVQLAKYRSEIGHGTPSHQLHIL